MPRPLTLVPVVATLCALAAPAAALDQLNLILPNARNLPMGDTGSVEAGAVVGRTSGAAAAWYNPAGVPGEERREVTASASIFDYQRTAIESPYSSDERRTLTIVPGFAGASEPISAPFGEPDDKWGFGLIVATPVQWATSVSQQEQVRSSAGVIGYGESFSSTYLVYQPTLAIGRTLGEHQRIGVSGSLMIDQLSVQRGVTELDSAKQTAVSSSTQIHGSCFLVSLSGGWQWQEPSGWNLGATATLPGIRVWSSGDRTDSAVATDNLAGTSTVVGGSNNDYDFAMDAPASLTVAGARVRETWSLELDLTLSLPTPERDVLPGTTLTGATVGPGNTITNERLDVPGVSNVWRWTLNGALGGSYRLSKEWSAHAGILSDRTTVGESELFVPVNLWSVTTGLSVRGANTLVTMGMGYSWATDGTAQSTDLASGATAESDLNIRIFRVIVGTSYRF